MLMIQNQDLKKTYQTMDQGDPHQDISLVSLASKRLWILIRQLLYIGWFFWSLPFRVFVSVGYYSLLTVVLQPLDFAQQQVFGKEFIGCEKGVQKFRDNIKPLWDRIFPFPSTSPDQFLEQVRPQPRGLQEEPSRKDRERTTEHMPSRKLPPSQQQQEEEATAAPLRPIFEEETGLRYRGKDREKKKDKPNVPRVDWEFHEDDDDDAEDTGEEESDYFRQSGSIHNDFPGDTEDKSSEPSFDSESSFKLPESTRDATSAEIDKAVMLAIEAKQTHLVVEKLFWIAVMLMAVVGLILIRVDFTRDWQGRKLAGNVEPALGFEGVFASLVVMTIAFRSDFPFNLGVLMLVVFFSGIVFGTIISRNAFMTLHGNEATSNNDD